MYNYTYTKNRIYINDKIIKLQKHWRLLQFKRAYKNKNVKLGNYYLKYILKIKTEFNFCKYLFCDIESNICKYDHKLINLLTIYRKNIILSLLYFKFNTLQLKQNLEKYIFIMIINITIKKLNKFYLKIDKLNELAKQYIIIYNNDFENKNNLLKSLLNKHIIKTEKIINKYKFLGYDLISKNIKSIQNKTYESIYEKYMMPYVNDFNHKKSYNILNCFFIYNNIYDFLFNNNKIINTLHIYNNLIDTIQFILNNI
jgi:hypothetical protein